MQENSEFKTFKSKKQRSKKQIKFTVTPKFILKPNRFTRNQCLSK